MTETVIFTNAKQPAKKFTGQVREVSGAVDIGLGIYYTLALPAAAVKSVQWGLSLKRGLNAVRAGRVTADARRLAALSARLKKIRSLSVSSAARRLKTSWCKAWLLYAVALELLPFLCLQRRERHPLCRTSVSALFPLRARRYQQTARRNPAEPLPVVRL